MKYLDIKKYLEKIKVFSINDLEKIDDKFNKKKVYLWTQKGYLKNIRKGYYILGNIEINDNFLYLISNKCYSPSYISLETALSFYGVIPETVYEIIGITSKKTFEFEFKNIIFSYKSIKPELFFGFDSIKFGTNSFFIGELEKVLLDYLYLKKEIKDLEDFNGLRFNKEILRKKINIKKLLKYTEIFNKKFLSKKVEKLIYYINN